MTARIERQRLTRAFRDIFVASLLIPAASVAACGDSSTNSPEGVDASVTPDATVGDSAVATQDGSPADAGSDAAADASVTDAPAFDLPDGCAPYPYDAGDAGADAAIDMCANLVHFPCGLPADIVPRDQCFLQLNDCDRICTGAYFNCHTWDDSCVDGSLPPGPVTVDCVTCLGQPGRKPRGLASAIHANCTHPLGDVFLAMAHLEAASVDAFRMLRRDLVRFGAPLDLVRGAAKAMRDETRHARVMNRLARRYGASVTARAKVAPTPKPTLEAFARENAVEGCVNETYAALVASWQAENAGDPVIARAMKRVAADETKHAALSRAIARWAETRLDARARERIARAEVRAAQALLTADGRGNAPHLGQEWAALAGVPSPAIEQRLAKVFVDTLWPAEEAAA